LNNCQLFKEDFVSQIQLQELAQIFIEGVGEYLDLRGMKLQEPGENWMRNFFSLPGIIRVNKSRMVR
jgi:hypothetical protein